MRNLALIGIISILCISLIGCSSSGAYDSEEAIKRGDVVLTPLEDYNLETFERFLKNFSNKKEDAIRITGYTLEGDPIFRDLHFDGEVIHYSYDNSNDQYGQPENLEDICKEIKPKEIEDDRVDFLVSNCTTIEDQSIIEVRKDQITYNWSQ